MPVKRAIKSRMLQVEKEGLVEVFCSTAVRTAALSLLRLEKKCLKWWRREPGVPGYFRDLSNVVIEACRGAAPFSLHHNASIDNFSLLTTSSFRNGAAWPLSVGCNYFNVIWIFSGAWACVWLGRTFQQNR